MSYGWPLKQIMTLMIYDKDITISLRSGEKEMRWLEPLSALSAACEFMFAEMTMIMR